MTTQRTGSEVAQPDTKRVLALSGGVGGAKLALGLSAVLNAGALTVAVNTADDFEHLGLYVSPDLDTVLYTLAGVSDPVRGWGRAEESWNFMGALASLGGETWFALGDRDLAVHIERTRRLRAGESLTSIVADMACRLNVADRIVPMTDSPVHTVVHTRDGPLPFQDYFVRYRCAPVITAISFAGIAEARPSPAFVDAIADPGLTAIVIAPSNPWLSIDPILAVPGVREALERLSVPVVAVSPIIHGKAVKGPTAKIMNELGIDVTPSAIAHHYRGLIDGLVIDESDAAVADRVGVPVAVTRTLMNDLDDRRHLARAVLAFAETPRHSESRMNPVDARRMDGNGSLWAVVPVKLFAHTKRRLMPVLSCDERRTLTGAMLEDVLSALMRARCLAGVIVVTSERNARAMAQAAGAAVMNDGENTGMNAAVAKGALHLAERGCSGMLAIPADVPWITVADVEAIALAHRAAPSVTLVPASKDGGTNALACSPPLVIPCRFGEDSLHEHRDAARARGITAGLVQLERVGHDIDRPDDLADFLLRPSPTQSYAYLISSGIAQRLRSVDRCREARAGQPPP